MAAMPIILRWIARSITSTPSPTKAAAVTPFVAPATLCSAMRSARSHFAEVFGSSANPASSVTAADGLTQLAACPPYEAWMQTYYRRPRPDLLLGAVLAGLESPEAHSSCGPFTGPHALANVVFLARVLPTAVPDAAGARELLAAAMAAAAAAAPVAGPPVVSVSEALDSIVRAMALSRAPHLVTCAMDVARHWREGLRAARVDDEHLTLPASLVRIVEGSSPVFTAWPIPSLGIASFKRSLRQEEYACWGSATRHNFLRTHAFHVMARQRPAAFSAAVPDLATTLTRCMVDGYWAHMYATGDVVTAVSRVLDIATPYVDFYDDYGDAWVTRYGEAGEAVNSDYSRLPDELVDDPLTAMRFETSRYALWSLLVHGATHVTVGDCFSALGSTAYDRAALEAVSPLNWARPGRGGMTAFGERQLRLIQIVWGAMQSLHQRASAVGIGSGLWPASFDTSEAAATARAVAAAAWGVTPGEWIAGTGDAVNQ